MHFSSFTRQTSKMFGSFWQMSLPIKWMGAPIKIHGNSPVPKNAITEKPTFRTKNMKVTPPTIGGRVIPKNKGRITSLFSSIGLNRADERVSDPGRAEYQHDADNDSAS